MESVISEILFLGERFDAKSIVDILLVAAIFFVVFQFIDIAQTKSLMRGLIVAGVIAILIFLLTDLPALNWLMATILPALLIIIPVIFAPEIRRGIERIGRMRTFREWFAVQTPAAEEMYQAVDSIVLAASRLSSKRHGALIVLENFDDLSAFKKTGIEVDSLVSAELLLQVFYPNTPLHDGAVVISRGRLALAACVMPLSSRDVLDKTPEHQMGLRHRAALGTSEQTDAIVVVVSEETGQISIAQNGQIKHDVKLEYLRTYLKDAYKAPDQISFDEKIKATVDLVKERINRRDNG